MQHMLSAVPKYISELTDVFDSAKYGTVVLQNTIRNADTVYFHYRTFR